MADIRIAKPAAGISENIPSEPGARFVFEFPTTDATLLKDGDNLVINFPDGSQVSLQDFYSEYDEENLPSFVMDDIEVAAQDFFTAMNEPDLMPAAGPGTGGDAAANARYHAYDSMALAQGIDHLWQLDWGMSRAFDHEDEFNSWGRQDDLDGQNPAVNTLVARAEIPEPETPDRDAPSHELPDLRPETPIDRPVYEPVYRPEPTPPADHNPPYEPVAPTPPVADNNPPYEPVVPPTTTPETPVTPPTTPPVNPPSTDNEDNDPKPKNEEPSVDVPVRPKDPDEKDPDPGKPEDPDDPVVPGEPNTPGGTGFVPITGKSHVVVDEGAMKNDANQSIGNHNRHGAEGEAHFNVHIPVEEGGTITLDFGAGTRIADIQSLLNGGHIEDGKIVFTIAANGSTAQMTAGEGLAFLTHDGVLLSNFRPVYDGNGNWHVDYDYKLTDNQWHDKSKPYNGNFEDDSHSNPVVDDTEKDINNDGLIFDSKAVHITVKDTKGGADGTGDVRHDWISVEVHDDVPVLESVKNTTAADDLRHDDTTTQITGTLDGLNFGADYAIGEVGLNVIINGVEFKGTQDAAGKWSFTPQGDKIDPSDVGSFALNDDFTFVYTRPTVDLDDNLAANTYRFDVKVIDSDKDVAPGSMSVLVFGKPTFDPDPDPDPDPNPDDPSNPKLPENAISHVVTDDSGLSTGAQKEVKGDTESATDASKFVVNMNGHKLGVEIGEGDNKIVLEFDAQGNLLSQTGDSTNSEYGNMVITGVHADTSTNKLTIEYKFTQTKNYTEKHIVNEDIKDADGKITTDHTDEHAANVDKFDVKLYDRDHDWAEDNSYLADTGHIYVSIEDDAPTQIDLGQDQLDLPDWGDKVLVDANGEPVTDENGNPVTQPGTDAITIPVSGLNIGADLAGKNENTAEVSIKLTGKDKSEIANVTFKATLDHNGEYVFSADGNTTDLSLSKGENGQWQIKYDRPASDKSNWTNNEYNFEVKVTDSDGDSVSDTVKVTTYAKPNFVNPENPENPGPDPSGDPYNMGATVSQVTTDETWLAPDDDTRMPGGTANGKEPTAANDQLTAGEKTDDAANVVSASASSSFAVSLNGNAYNITIGEGDSALTLSFDGKGNFQSATSNGQTFTNWKDVTEHQVKGKYGDFQLVGDETPSATSDGRLKFEYEYTQTKQYDHNDAGVANTFDQVKDGAEHIQLVVQDTVKGDDDGRVTGNIKVNIEDDAPVASGVTVTSAAEFTGSFNVNFGADQSATIPFTYKDADGNVVNATPSEVQRDEAGNIISGKYTLAVEGGQLVLNTTNGKDFTYKFNPDDDHKDLTFNDLKFEINAIDGDGDQRQIEVAFNQNNKPTLTPDPTKPGEDPTPDPNDPQKPEGIPANPQTNEMKIILDEAAFADKDKGENDPAKGGTGDSKHSWHGTGSFNVQFNGHENGIVMLGQGNNVYLIEIETNDKGYETGVKYYDAKIGADGKIIYDTITDENGVEHQVAQKGEEITDPSTIKFTDNGVEVTLGDIKMDAGSTSGNTGKYQINYSYELKEVVEHETPGETTDNSNVLNDTEKTTHDPIQIIVKDQTGDIDTGKITIEVHDDGPVIEAVKTGSGNEQSVVNDAVIFRYGADDRNPFATSKTEYHKVTVSGDNAGVGGTSRFEQTANGNILWTHYDENGNATSVKSDDISQMKDGETWKSGEVQITKTGNEHKFDYVNKESDDNAKHNFTVKIVDADGDAATATIKLGAPTLDIPEIPNKPGLNPDDPTTGNAHIVVDEGYLAGGNIKHGHEAGTAENPISGKFTFTLPGEEGGEITLAIPGTTEGTTVKFTVGTDGTTITQVFGQDASFITSNGVVIKDFEVVKSGADGEYTVNYKYYLTGRQDHEDPETPAYTGDITDDFTDNNVKFDFNAIEVTVKDGTGDTVKGQINVEVHDDVPVVTGKEGIKFEMKENAAFEKGLFGIFEDKLGADGAAKDSNGNELAPEFALGIEAGKENTGLMAFVGGEEKEIILTKDEATGDIKGMAGGTEIFTVSMDNNGKVTLVQNEGAPHINNAKIGADGKVITDSNGNTVIEDKLIQGIQVSKTRHDDDGDSSTGTVNVEIAIKDDVPEINAKTTGTAHGESHPISLDFTSEAVNTFDKAHGWKGINETDNLSTRVAYHSDVKFIGTYVGYNMDENGHVTWFADRPGDLSNTGGFTDNKLVLSDKGLGVGRGKENGGDDHTKWTGENDVDGKDMGVSFNADTNPNYWNTIGHHDNDYAWSQGIVIESEYTRVYYGMNIKLSDFGEKNADGTVNTNRAIIMFYQTPRNSNDNIVVKQVEVSASDRSMFNEHGEIVIQVPDGFTKAIVAPIPTKDEFTNSSTNKSSLSHFSIEKFGFTKNMVEKHGEVEIVKAGDDATLADISWDWSAVQEAMEGQTIKIEDTLGADNYTVKFVPSDDGRTVTAVIGGGTQGNDVGLNGNALFKASLGTDGKWSVEQFYKFKVNGKDPEFNSVKFTIKDKDGSTSESIINIDLRTDATEERFDNVEMSYFNNDQWDHDAEKDNAFDVLTGHGHNDLIYGRGGNDILFGDTINKQGFIEIGKLADKSDWDPITDLKKYLDSQGKKLDAGHKGENCKRGTETIYNFIKGKSDDKDYLAELQETVEKVASNPGDDAIFGGVGNDILFGGAGDDYLDGTGNLYKAGGQKYNDQNMLFGGSGNDIMVYNSKDNPHLDGDILMHGGKDADIILAGKVMINNSTSTDAATYTTAPSLGTLLDNQASGQPKVYDVEVMLHADIIDVTTLGITSLSSLADYGIILKGNTVILDSKTWGDPKEGGTESHPLNVYSHKLPNGVNLTLEVLQSQKVQYAKIEKTDSGLKAVGQDGKDLLVDLDDGDGSISGATKTSAQEGFEEQVPGGEAATFAAMDSDPSADQPSDRMLFGDGANRQGEITEEIATEMFGKIMSMDAEQNRQFGDLIEGGNNIEASSDNNDVITGGMGNELIFAMGGDDYIDGGEGIDSIFAGSGNDIICYDENDVAINGGSGIDLIVAGEDAPSLEKLLDGPADNDSPQPIVNNVEMMLKVDKKAEEELNIRNMADVAALGIVVAGNEIVVDADKWQQIVQDNPSGKTVSFAGQTESGHKMILEVAKDGDHKIFTQTNGSDKDDTLTGDELANIMHGMDGDDQLFGGLGDDKLFGDKGDDYLDGGEGRDWIEGGEGNDIIMLDPSDYLIDGGDDEIDFILSTDKNASLAQMLENGANPDSAAETPMVRDVEVLVSGNVDNIKSVQDLADKGIELNETKTGINLSKDSGWKKYEDKTSDNQDDSAGKSSAATTHKYYNEDYDLVVETTVPVEDDDFDVYVPVEKPAPSVADAAANTGADVVPSDDTGQTTENMTEDSDTGENKPEGAKPEESNPAEGKSEENKPEESKTENVRPEDDGKTADEQTDGEENESGQPGADDDSDKDHQNRGDLPEKTEEEPESENPDDSGPANENKPVAEKPNTEDPADEILKGKEEGKEPTTQEKPSTATESRDTDSGSDKDTSRNDGKGDDGDQETLSKDTSRFEKNDDNSTKDAVKGSDSPTKDSGKGSASEQSTVKGGDSHELPTTSGPAEADIMPASEPADTSIMNQIAAATSQVLADSGNGLG